MKTYTARIISTGTEILQGLYPDTNAQGLSQMLLAAGIAVMGHAAVADDRMAAARALEEASDADLVVITGGLGPTEDDVNREVIAEFCGAALVRDVTAEEMMRERFRARGRTMPERNVVQAMLPKGCRSLYNYWGTAAGFVMRRPPNGPWVAALPGPPSEWRPMFSKLLVPVLDDILPDRGCIDVYTMGVGIVPESTLNEALRDLFDRPGHENPTILASRGSLRIRLIARGKTLAEARTRNAATRVEVLERVGSHMIASESRGDVFPAQGLVQTLQSRNATLALAESCTGGGIASLVTDVPGASTVFRAGYVTYANEAKVRDLNVPMEMIASDGAVSESVARAMAAGARARAESDYGLSITGVAGPDGGTVVKPVGTVWFGFASATDTAAIRQVFSGDRESVRVWAAHYAVEYARRFVLGLKLDAEL